MSGLSCWGRYWVCELGFFLVRVGYFGGFLWGFEQVERGFRS